MAYLLNIETATTVCSVSLAENEKMLFCKELNEGFTHAENLHLFIEEALKSCDLRPQDLSAIAVSKGPGSYTGLRIGVSAAKGMAFALRIPLIGIDTLQLMSVAAKQKNPLADLFCPMLDARRMEVYMALYDRNLNLLGDTQAFIVDEHSVSVFSNYTGIYFFGDGMNKCRDLLSRQPSAKFIEGITPSAAQMCELSFKKFELKQVENLAYFEPFYLKDFMVAKKKSTNP